MRWSRSTACRSPSTSARPRSPLGDGTPFFQVFGADLSLNIGDFVTITADSLAFSNDALTASNARVFLGQGPLVLNDGAMNPSARGILLDGVTLSIHRYGAAGSYTYALWATGSVHVLGIPGVTFGGTMTVQFNNSGMDRTIPRPSLSDIAITSGAQFFDGMIALTVVGQTLNGHFTFTQETVDTAKVTKVAFDGVMIGLGDGSPAPVQVHDGHGTFTLNAAGLAGRAQASVGVLGTFDMNGDFTPTGNVSFGGTFLVAINTAPTPLYKTVDGQQVIDVPAGPYLRIAGTGITINLPGPVTMTADVAIEQYDDAGMKRVKVAAANVTLSLGDAGGNQDYVNISGGEAFFVILPTGLAGTFQGTVSTTLPGVQFTGTFGVTINTTGAPVHQTFMVGLRTVMLDLNGGNFTRVTGQGVALTILGQTLSGDFTLEQLRTLGADGLPNTGDGETSVVRVTFQHVTLRLGDGYDRPGQRQRGPRRVPADERRRDHRPGRHGRGDRHDQPEHRGGLHRRLPAGDQHDRPGGGRALQGRRQRRRSPDARPRAVRAGHRHRLAPGGLRPEPRRQLHVRLEDDRVGGEGRHRRRDGRRSDLQRRHEQPRHPDRPGGLDPQGRGAGRQHRRDDRRDGRQDGGQLPGQRPVLDPDQ